MKYLNPITALGLDAEQMENKEELKKEKKRLLAEFELADSSVIRLNGRSMDKASVIQLFETLEDENQRKWQLQIFENQTLLSFLEDASLELYYQGDVNLLSALPEDLLEYIAPYFAESFNQRLYHAFRQKDWEEIEILSTPPLPIPATFHAACFQDTYRHIHRQLAEIGQLSERIEKGEKPGPRIQEVVDEMLIDSMNQLPAYFSGSRDSYSMVLEDLAIAVHNTHKRVELGILIIRQGLKLDISEQNRQRLQHILDQLLELSPGEKILEAVIGSGKKKNPIRPWLIGAGVVALAWALLNLLF